jgi:hypothetical protein
MSEADDEVRPVECCAGDNDAQRLVNDAISRCAPASRMFLVDLLSGIQPQELGALVVAWTHVASEALGEVAIFGGGAGTEFPTALA